MLEIYFEDLTEEKQEEVLEFMSITSPEDANLDVTPIMILEDPDDLRDNTAENSLITEDEYAGS